MRITRCDLLHYQPRLRTKLFCLNIQHHPITRTFDRFYKKGRTSSFELAFVASSSPSPELLFNTLSSRLRPVTALTSPQVSSACTSAVDCKFNFRPTVYVWSCCYTELLLTVSQCFCDLVATCSAVLVIAGTTAVGNTDLSLQLTNMWNGVVINFC